MGIKSNLLPERARLESGDSFLVDAAAGTGRLSIEAAQNQLTRNQNLLDNPRFQINQRGKDSYVAGEYSADRWHCTSDARAVSIVAEGISITAIINSQVVLEQPIEFDRVKGCQITFSALIDDKLISASGNVPSEIPQDYVQIFSSNDPSSSYDVDFRVKNGIAYAGFFSRRGANVASIINAAKLELGEHQTLAHQDASGNWVLNDPPPNKALELAKCQRYFINGSAGTWYTAVRVAGQKLQINIPVAMRARPATPINFVSEVYYQGVWKEVSVNQVLYYPTSVAITYNNPEDGELPVGVYLLKSIPDLSADL